MTVTTEPQRPHYRVVCEIGFESCTRIARLTYGSNKVKHEVPHEFLKDFLLHAGPLTTDTGTYASSTRCG